MVIKVKHGSLIMRKTIKKALRIPYMKFYIDRGTNLLQKTTKEEIKEKLNSVIFINGVYEINIDHKNKTTIINWRL